MNWTEKSELNNLQMRLTLPTLAGKLVRIIFSQPPVYGGKNDGLVSLFNGISTFVFNAKAILLEEL